MLGRVRPSGVHQKKTLDQLPWSVVRKLTQLLDRPHPDHHNWQALLSHCEVVGLQFHADEVANFQSIANRAVGSPSEAVIQDFITRGLTTDDLYLILEDMGHKIGMKILQDQVSPHLLATTAQETSPQDDPPRSNNGGGGRESSQDCTSSSGQTPIQPQHQYHPEAGPLPLNVPPTAMAPTVIRVSQGHTHDYPPVCQPMGYNGYSNYAYQHHQPSNLSTQYPNHTNSPNQSGYFFSPQTTPTAQFSSPPPPPYSPHIHLPLSLQPTPPTENIPSQEPLRLSSSPQGQRQYNGSGSSPRGSPGPQSNGTSPVFSVPQTLPFSWGERSEVTTSRLSGGSPSSSLDTASLPSTISSDVPSSAAQPITAPNPGPDLRLSILHFSYTDLSAATFNFTEGLIGHGAFGSVFRANIRGCGHFAIKKLHNRSEMQSEMEGTLFFEPLHQESFMLELQSLIKYKHRNILSLVAISDDGPRPCLVYEYMENGSLADCLLGKRENITLSWKLRMEIVSQVADALNFLHIVNDPHCLIHGDVKSSNILLDRHMTPKLSDFGLARECYTRPSHMTTVSATSRVAMGTVAYMAPEFFRNPKPSSKTDVYAFGVVMLEVFTGQAADDPSRDIRTLVYHLQPLFNDPDKNRELILHEADVRGAWPSDTAVGFFVIATFCLQDKPKLRPPMNQVRDQITILLDEAVLQQNLHLSQSRPQQTRWS